MKKSWAMKWARDLEKTSAKQATGVLNNGRGGFCCLGRLCVVAGKRGSSNADGGISYGDETTVLPSEVMALVEMKTSTGAFGQEELTDMNDSGVSFRELAKIIRKNWRDL
jgi:hypothetical protein